MVQEIDLNKTDSQFEFLKPGQSLEDKGVAMIIHGDPGTGKTSLIKTLLGWEHGRGYVNEPYCKPEEIIVIDVEAGDLVLSSKGKRVVTSYRVQEDADSITKFKSFIQYLHEGNHPFKFVFVDNMSELEKFFLICLTTLKEQPVPRQKEWGDDAFYMRKYIRDLRNLTWEGINVVFNFWSMLMPVEGIDKQIIVPMVMRKTAMEYVGLVDHVGYIGMKKDGTRFIQFESNDLVKCKERDTGDTDTPILEKFERPDLALIFRKIDTERKSHVASGSGKAEGA